MRSGWAAVGLLWGASRALTVAVGLWVLANAVVPALVVVALGAVVGAVGATLGHGGDPVDVGPALLAAGLAYALSLVLEAGSHDELLAAGGRYAELFTLQAAGYR